MIDFDIVTIIIGILILAVLCSYIKFATKKANIYLFFFSIFYIYLIYVLKYTIFPIPLDMAEVFKDNSVFTDGINVIPLKNISFQSLLEKQVLYNILLSVPFGFGIAFITKITKKKLLLVSVLFGIIVESLQLLVSLYLEYTYRIIDINDIIFNFMGVIVGYCIFKFFSILLIKFVDKNNFKLDAFSSYIYNISKESF
ncbi:VanZ family protein [Wukongibacter sp. M2B1]|uniref:VanZ family protein n=1 Tax=Wukongibacter sp. M2B1 TaxID=3088895 RepID=UPI003D7A6AEE